MLRRGDRAAAKLALTELIGLLVDLPADCSLACPLTGRLACSHGMPAWHARQLVVISASASANANSCSTPVSPSAASDIRTLRSSLALEPVKP